MCPADPHGDPNEPEADASFDDEAAYADDAPSTFDIDALRLRADLPGLLALAKAYRSGSAPGGRDFAKCLDAYRAAAELGSAEASYGVALFYVNGGSVIAQDLKEGTMHLRAAAERGSIPAKVYLGNLYELGIHYKADAEKADVWYRNAARAARVDADQGTKEWTRALAELGCARQALELASSADIDDGDKAMVLARAKAHGHGLRIRDEAIGVDRATLVDSLASAESAAAGAATATPPPVAVDVKGRERKDTAPESPKARKELEARQAADAAKAAKAVEAAEKKAAKKTAKRGDGGARFALGLGAFGYAVLFAVAGVGAGYAATLGAAELVSRGQTLPVLGTHTRYVFPIVLALVGVLPAWLVYRLGTVLKAIVIGAALAGVGWVAWGTGQGALDPDRALQALAFGLAGFLAGLLVLGLFGGAKPPRPRH